MIADWNAFRVFVGTVVLLGAAVAMLRLLWDATHSGDWED